ncbi:MAG: hypothetical protein ACI9FO_001193 [Methylophagaceae bacterium]|jgi:hypothetical protein
MLTRNIVLQKRGDYVDTRLRTATILFYLLNHYFKMAERVKISPIISKKIKSLKVGPNNTIGSKAVPNL